MVCEQCEAGPKMYFTSFDFVSLAFSPRHRDGRWSRRPDPQVSAIVLFSGFLMESFTTRIDEARGPAAQALSRVQDENRN
jgi:hypothetical protein